jgi:carbamoylphosphate synthase small subunit
MICMGTQMMSETLGAKTAAVKSQGIEVAEDNGCGEGEEM